MFLYSQDLSNCTTGNQEARRQNQFLYSQDLSNCTTEFEYGIDISSFCTLKI